MNTNICNSSFLVLVKNCFTGVVIVYGTLNVVFEMLYTMIPIGIITVVLLSVLVYLIRIPPPDKATLDAIIRKDVRDTFENESNNVMKSVAHRGAGFDAPENSIESFEMCFSKGCKAVAFDIKLTSDDVVIVFHDETLERLTDLTLAVGDTCWEELKNRDISLKHPFKSKFNDIRIPTLNQAVEFCLAFKESRMLIDLKDNNRKFVQIVLDLFEKYPELYSRAVITAFYPNLIYFIRRSNSKIVCGLGWSPKYYSNYTYNLQTGIGERRSKNILKHLFLVLCDNVHEWFLPRFTYSILGISLILLRKDLISIKVVEEWRTKGVRVIAWNVNQPVEKQFFTRTVKVTYMTDTLTGESSIHSLTA